MQEEHLQTIHCLQVLHIHVLLNYRNECKFHGQLEMA